MSVICINDDEIEHDFDNEYFQFLHGKVGSYDGSFNAVEQFKAYLDSLN